MSAEQIKRLADEYAHCYAFVGDDTMPLKRAELHAAIDAAVVPSKPGCGYPYCGGNAPECMTCGNKRAAPNEPVAPLPSADDLYDKIEEVLLHHRLSNWCMDEDGEDLLPLVDRLCDDSAKDISSGKHEIRLICDAIYNEVLTAERASPHADKDSS
jgi:hypothetical protein